MLLFKIAWRNIWRNKVRSLVVITSIVLGIFAGVFTISFSLGLNNQRTKAMLNSMVSHIQIHDSTFNEEPITDAVIKSASIDQKLKQFPQIEAYSKRIVVTGMVQTAANGGGVMVKGINPDEESKVTDMHSKIIEGKYLKDTKKNSIIIGQKLAEKLKVSLKKYVVLTFQDKDGEVVSSRFKVVGIFKSISSKLDESLVYIDINDAQRLLGLENKYHEVALMLNDVNTSKELSKKIQAKFPESQVEPWQEVSPELGYADETMAMSLYIIMGIILLALIGGIINTMLMAVLERTRELGMILCVGMNKTKVFIMIMIETMLLSLIGGPIGLIIGYVFVNYYGKKGISLTGFDQGLEAMGMSSIVYPEIELNIIINIVIMVIITALISAIIPSRRAIKLKPAQAVRAI